MASMRGILNVFSREVLRGRDAAPLTGEELSAFIRTCSDSAVFDTTLQQAGSAPFWPQSPAHHALYAALLADPARASVITAAAGRSLQARRSALAHLWATPSLPCESALPRRQHALIYLMSADAAHPQASRIYFNRAQDSATAWGGDVTQTDADLCSIVAQQLAPQLDSVSDADLAARFAALPCEALFTCRDDRALIQRGWGARLDVTAHVIWLDAATAALLDQAKDRLAVSGPDHLACLRDKHCTAQQALGEIGLFARLLALAGGNRALRQYWEKCEEHGLASRIGGALGLVLGDLQQAFEELTRRDRYQTVPDLRRLQDRMLVRTLTARAAPAALNDSA